MLRFVKGSLRQLSCSWISLRLWRKSSSRKIRFSRLLQGIDQPHEFLHGMGQGNIIVLTFSTFFWQGIQQRQDSNDKRTWLRCKGHIANNVNHVFPYERNSL